MMNIIFIAPPAAGKGTLSKYLEDQYGFIHISTGDLLRDISKENTTLGKEVAKLMLEGKFISDDIMMEIFEKKFQKIQGQPFILDGMPRTIDQAKYLDTLFKKYHVDNYKVINITISDDLLKKRATGRRICSKCKASYNVYFEEFKPKVENICDFCKNELLQREDDREETFIARMKTYEKETQPLLKYYDEQHVLYKVDANQPQAQIIRDIDKIIQGVKND